MSPLAPRASMAPRAVLFAVFVLLLAAVFYTPTPASGSSLLLGGSGFVLERPLLLQGVDVGAALSAMRDDIAELKRRNTQLQAELNDSKREVTALQGTVGQLQATVSTQAGRLSQAETNISTLEAARRVMNNTVTEHGERLASAESNVAGLDARLLLAESAATALTSRVTATEGNLTALSTRVTNAEGAAAELTARVTTAETAATALTDRVTAAENAVSGLTNRVTFAESATATLTNRVAAAEGNIGAVGNRLTAAENLGGAPTILMTTVLALRDLTGGSTLVTTVTGLRDNSGSSALVTALGNLRNKTDSSSALIRSLPCYGESSSSDWRVWKDEALITRGLYVDVSMAACGFTSPPRHVTSSLFGLNRHWLNLGPSAVYSLTATSFRIYIMQVNPDTDGTMIMNPYAPAQVVADDWKINWMAAR